MLFTRFLILFLWFAPNPTFSSPPFSFGTRKPHAVIHDVCPSSPFAHRTGREFCWAEYSLSLNRRLCVPHTLWQEWLRQKSTRPLCGSNALPWKARSPLLNSPTGAAKVSWKTQRLKTLPTLSEGPLGFIKNIERIRETLSLKLSADDPLGVMRSLLLDEKVSDSPLPLLRHLGFVHLASASGIHLYALGTWIDRAVMLFSKALGIQVGIALCLSRALALTTCIGVWMLSGCRLGLLRPAFVILIKEAASLLGVRWLRFYPLVTALLLEFSFALLRSLQTGQSLSQSGRWIYALAIGGGMMGFHFFSEVPFRNRGKPRSIALIKNLLIEHLGPHLGLAFGSWITVALWEVWHEGTLVVATAPLSLITLPVVCLGIYPIALLAVLLSVLGLSSLSVFLIKYTSLSLSMLLIPLLKASLWVGNLWIISRTAVLAGMICGLALTFLTLKSMHRKALFLLLISALLWRALPARNTAALPHNQEFLKAEEIEQLDVGQGDSALVRYRDQAMGEHSAKWGLIDTGSFHSLSDTAWLQIFAQRGIHRLSWIALTHLDEDHTGGLLRLARIIPIDCVVTSNAELRTERGETFTRELFKSGIRIKDWGTPCVPFPVLGPVEGPADRSANARMSAVWIPLHTGGFYFSAGDATAAQEKRLARWAKDRESEWMKPEPPGTTPWKTSEFLPRILKVSHHGSKTSTTTELITQLKPTQAWISVGVGNSYGHPHPRVLQRLYDAQLWVRRTDLHGKLSSSTISVTTGDVRHLQPGIRR